MGERESSASAQLSLTIGAHEVADALYRDSEEGGVLRPALFKQKGEAVLFGMAMGLALGKKEEGETRTFAHINSLQDKGDLDLSSLIHLMSDEEDRLNPVKALGGYASWGLEHLREYYYKGTKYQLSKVTEILGGKVGLCGSCGIMIRDDGSLEKCPNCNLLL